jgi:hypothetical protein
MKKIILSLLLVAAAGSLFAQSVHFGIKAGLNDATIDATPDNAISSSNKTGFSAGAFAEFDFTKFSIQPGLFFTQKGSDAKVVYPQGGTNEPLPPIGTLSKATYNYLEVPVNALYNIPVGVGKVFIGAGPYLGIAVSAHYKTSTPTGSGSSTTTETSIDIGGNDGIKRTDAGLNALAGINFKNGLLFSAGYDYGLTNIWNGDDSKVKNRVLNFSVGYAFL